MKQIAYVVFSNWRTGDSGVDTFVRHMAPLFEAGHIAGELVEIPYKEVDCRGSERGADAPHAAGRVPSRAKGSGGARLLAGYVRRVAHDVRILWPLRGKLRGRLLMTNQFGCETLPLALRLLSPWIGIVAVCHTHPSRTLTSSSQDRVRSLIEKMMYRCANKIVYNSNSVREEWRQRMGIERIKGEVIWYGIDPPDEELPEDYPDKPESAVDFVCVSRFVHWKGHKELITAFAKARRKAATGTQQTLRIGHRTAHAALRLILVGNGPTWHQCIQHARDLGLDPVVARPSSTTSNACQMVLPKKRLANSSLPPNCQIDQPTNLSPPNPRASIIFLDRRMDGARYFNGADVGVQLSTEPEAFGIVLLEAMSRGKPVLASRIGGIPEVVAEDEAGVLVDPHDADGVADAMLDLASDSEKRIRLGRAGRCRWESQFTVTHMQRQYVEYLSGTSRIMP